MSSPNKKNEKVEKLANKYKSKKRKYDGLYLKLGFTWSGSSHEPNPQCVICSEFYQINL